MSSPKFCLKQALTHIKSVFLVAEKMEISVESPEPSTDDASETQLITYLQNILKVQIIPMKFSTLRELVAEAPKKMKLFEYIEDKYPDVQFLDFLKKYPNIFTVNRDRTVVLVEGNDFTKRMPKQQENRSQDEVDGHKDMKEYISDSESSEDDENLNDEGRRLLESPVASDTVDGVRTRTVTDSSVSSDSSADVFSSQIVQTSDSLASSCSSNSSLDN